MAKSLNIENNQGKMNKTRTLRIFIILGIIGNLGVAFVMFLGFAVASAFGGPIDPLVYLYFLIPGVHLFLYGRLNNLDRLARNILLILSPIKTLLAIFGTYYFIVIELADSSIIIPSILAISSPIFASYTLYFHKKTVLLF